MHTNIFSWIRKRQFTLQLFVAIMVNMMVFSQPLSYALNNQNKLNRTYFGSSTSNVESNISLNALSNDIKHSKNNITSTMRVVKSSGVVVLKDADIISALEKQGIIGKSENFPIDDPMDNVFSFEMFSDVKTNKDIYLSYELFGLSDASQATKSVNSQLATGGLLVKTNKEWTAVEEKLDPYQLQKGKNHVFFTTPEDAKHQYMVRGLRLVYKDKVANKAINFYQKEAISYDGMIQISGFITDHNIQEVTIENQNFKVINGQFEAVVNNPILKTTLEVSYTNAKNETISENIAVKQLLEKPTAVYKEVRSLASASKKFVKGTKNMLNFAGATLQVDSLQLDAEQSFSITGLSYKDMPTLSREMVNVTADYKAYRMLPSGSHFEKNPAKISIKYDESKLPSGYTAKDIKTFYFDNDQKKWMELAKDTIHYETKEIVSKTTHFTDFINGIIKVPESPETGSYTPTSIKDIKAADPTAGVVSIAPPTPNNMGTVNTSFPIKLPAGRAGMQPELSVNYNSEGGNGWMGLGWDLSIPGVSLDTRWGAPRYDASKETEIYAMGGGMLTLKDGADYTNPHRKDNISRTSERQFYPRIEGSYAKVIRHGNSPTNYWWEVTDKTGNKSFYGGYTGVGVVNNSVLRTGTSLTDGNISYWGLYRTEDTNGNYVQYNYDPGQIISNMGNAPGQNGKEFYIQSIDYTKNTNAPNDSNFYRVTFNRVSSRSDVQINARNGVIQVTKDLLSGIQIQMVRTGTTPENIRSYKFEYNPNDQKIFHKTLLNRISEFDASGDLFYSNTMEYETKGNNGNPGSENDTNPVTNQNFFGPQTNITNDMPFDGHKTGDLIVLSDPVSVLGSTEMGGLNWGGYFGAGALCSGSNWFTGGANIGGSFSSGGSLSAFMDVNGDNLPDKVYSTENSGIKYIPNLGNLKFHTSALSLINFSNIGRNTSDSDSFGGSASFGIATLGGTYNTSKNVTSTYVTDTNGDGLVDLVDNGLVKFNETNSNIIQDISFSHDNGSTKTQNTIANGSFNLVNNPNVQIRTETREELEDKNPLHDIVKVWVAPRNGTISITSTASLASQPIPPSLVFPTQGNDQFYTDYDGVRLSVQREGVLLSPTQGHLLQPTFTNINGTPNTVTTNINFPTVLVTRGQRIYFRVQANQEGTFDRVSWNPLINYTDTVNPNLQGLNADGISYFNSSAEEGYIVSANSEVIIPANATNLSLTWPPLNGTFSDNLTFRIEQGTVTPNGTDFSTPVVVLNQTILNPNPISTVAVPNLVVDRAYRFSVTSSSNVNWRAIDWRPVISMTIPPTGTSPSQISQLYPVVNYGIFNRKVNEATSRVAINPAFPVYIRPEINILPFLTNMPNTTFGTRLIVKNNNGRVILNQLYNIDTNGTGSTSNLNDILLPTANLTNPIFVEYYTDSVAASDVIQNNPNAVRARIGQVVNPIINSIPNLPTTTNPLSIRITGVTIQNIAPTTENFTSAYYFNNTTTNNTPNIFTINPLNTLAVRVNLLTTGHAAIWVDLNRNNAIEANEFFASSSQNTVHNSLSITIPQATAVGLYNVRIFGGRNTPYTFAALNLLGGFNNLQNTTIRNYQINVVAPVAGNNPVNDVYCRAGNNAFGAMYRNWGQFAYHGGIVIARGVPLFRDTNGEITTTNGTGFTMVGNQVGIDTPQERNFPIFPLQITNHGYSATNTIRPIDVTTINEAINGTIAPGQQACITAWNSSSQDEAAQQALADCMSITNESVTNKRFHSLSPVNLQSIRNTNSNLWIWQGITDKIRVEPQHLSASRLGVPNINKIFVPIPVDIVNGPLATCQFPRIGAVPIIKKGEGFSVAASVGDGGVGFGGNRSFSFNWTELTAMDMNGDRYPDVLTRNNIRYTNGLGALSFDKGNDLGRVTRDETRSWGATASGTFKRAVTGPGKGFSVGKNAPKPTGKPSSDTSFNLGASWNDETPLGFFMDINGDGLPDRIDASNGPINVNLNLGYGFGPTQTWLNAFQLAPDGKLLSQSTNIGGGFGFTYGANAYGGGVSASSSEAITVTNFMDINGDGLPDLIFSENQYLLNTGNGFAGQGTVNRLESINNGESLSITVTVPICFLFWQVNITGSGGGDNTHSFDKNTYQDINGDGYPDILNADTNNSEAGKFHNIYLSRIGNVNALKKVNTPLGGSWEVSYVRDGNTFDMPQSKWNMNKVTTFDAFTQDETVAGSSDAFNYSRTVTTVNYKNPYHDRREREFFGYEKVIVNQHPMFNNSADEATTINTIYKYSIQEFHNRNYYLKGAVKRETLYETVGTADHMTTTPGTDDILWTENKTKYGIFKPSQSVNFDPSTTPLTGFTSNTYPATINMDVIYGTTANPVSSTSSNQNFICTDLDDERLFVTPLVSVKTFTEGDTDVANHKFAVTVMEKFDAFGNITQYRDYGEQDTDVYVSKIQYNPVTITGVAYNGFPSTIQVLDADGTTLKRERRAAYNTKGDLEFVRTLLNQPNELSSVKMEYDLVYGNLKKVIHLDSCPIGVTCPANNDATNGKFFREYFYDDVVNTYPVKVTDAFGYESETAYNYLFGTPIFTKDMNHQPMRTRIDDRGRLVEVTGPYELFLEGLEAFENAWTIRFQYQNNVAPINAIIGFENFDQYGNTLPYSTSDIVQTQNSTINATDSYTTSVANLPHRSLTRHFDPEFRTGPNLPSSNNQILTVTLADGFGSPVQVKKTTAVFDGTATISSTPNSTADNNLVWLIPGKVKADQYGRATESYYPTIQTVGTSFGTGQVAFPTNAYTYINAVDTTTPTLSGDYDVLDRPSFTQLPGEVEQTTMTYRIADGRFETVITNELGQVQKSYTDIKGRTLETIQESTSTSGNIVTKFKYDNLSQLKTVTDVADNITESFYDLAGRRTRLQHPDNGVTTFTYDRASNLVERKTSNILAANGQAIKYKYNYGRLEAIEYPNNTENNVNYFYGEPTMASALNDNAIGRLWYMTDATGTQYFEYGRLGEVVKNRRSVAVPGDRVYWFQTEWEYDTWNRVSRIKYPDEEIVKYHYNRGGELHAMTSSKPDASGNLVAQKDIISQLGYDKFGQRTYLRYGNGTETTYKYEDANEKRRRLVNMQVKQLGTTASGAGAGVTPRTFVNNKYTYDVLSNVLSIHNNLVALPTATQIGGRSIQNYTYDDLNRLTTATGTFVGRNDQTLNAGTINFASQEYSLAMSYDNQHNIVAKNQLHRKATTNGSGVVQGAWSKVEKSSYGLVYEDYNTADYTVDSYEYNQPHAPRKIVDQPDSSTPNCCDAANDPRVKIKTYDYDHNGNQTKVSQTTCNTPNATVLRKNLWDEENRLRAIDLNPEATNVHPIAIYTYDAGGERIIKHNSTNVAIYENALKVGEKTQTDFMIYPSGMLVARPASDGSGGITYTKHYFAGTQRVSSKIGTTTNLGKFLEEWQQQEQSSPSYPAITTQVQMDKANAGATNVFGLKGFNFTNPPIITGGNTSLVAIPAFIHSTANEGKEIDHYFFHPDHLGSSNYITNFVGEVSQHMEYFAFGETFIEEHKNSHNSPFKFNGKELDEESGYTYFGARYYDSRYSIWLSVDGEFENGPNVSPYVYCFNNPITLTDPDGNWPTLPSWNDVKKSASQAYNRTKAYASQKYNEAKNYTTQKYNEAKAYTSKKYSEAKTATTKAYNDSKTAVTKAYNDTKKTIIEAKDNAVATTKRTINDSRQWVKNNEKVITDVSQGMQDFGDGVAIVGYGLTLTGIGAEIGVPLAAFGNGLSTTGSLIELGVQLNNEDLQGAGTNVGFMVADKLVEKGLNKILPGAGKAVKDADFNLGTEILTQGAGLKVMAAERVVNKAQENK